MCIRDRHKGATSGHVQKVKQILIDCDQDALIVLVDLSLIHI